MALDEPHYTSLTQDGLTLSPLRYKDTRSSSSVINVAMRESGERRKRGIGVWSPLWMLGGTLTAAVFAIGHHLFDAHLDARSVAGSWTQANSGRVEIFFASAFKILFCLSAGVSVCQLSWFSLRHTPVKLADMDVLVGPPSLMILQRPNLITKTPVIIAITAVILASPLVTILAPSLHTRQAPPVSRTLSVPTLNTTTDAPLNDIYAQSWGGSYGVPTQTWDKTALVGILSETPVGWPMPQGCSPEALNTSPPAIRCSDLKPDQIDDGVEPMYRAVQRVFQDPPSAYLLGYDALSVGSSYQSSPLNFTVQNATTNVSDRYTWTMAYLPFLSSTVPAGSLINAAGSMCTFYNATHAASTHYFNGTQETRVSVVEFHNPLNTTYRQGYPSVNLSAPGTGSHFHLLAIADSISVHLEGNVVIDGHFGTVVATTLMTQSNIFEPYDADSMAEIGGQIFGLNTTAAVTNVSQALQDLVANITLGFIHLNTGLTTVNANVISTDIVYIYDRETLLATYSVAFFLLILMSAVGMFSLMKNGESNSNTFSRILVALRNPELDAVADAVDGRPREREADPSRLRLKLGEAVLPGRGVAFVFQVAERGQALEEK
ncbi:hypothetical protein B0H17DRAFT_1193942 [Mycena rosella]|uniref:Uncharacterized protein n=1 Tax=Mycena rosella TaxID=1033263 RepID=A0AAD7M6Y9_MYCRO|nr:hypothetical protein B0H17DRAFT_1193942 [Mycena rosella]